MHAVLLLDLQKNCNDKLIQLAMCAPNPDSCGGTGGCMGATYDVAFDYVSNSNGMMQEVSAFTVFHYKRMQRIRMYVYGEVESSCRYSCWDSHFCISWGGCDLNTSHPSLCRNVNPIAFLPSSPTFKKKYNLPNLIILAILLPDD